MRPSSVATAESAGRSRSGSARSRQPRQRERRRTRRRPRTEERGQGEQEGEQRARAAEERAQLEPEAQADECDQPIHDRSSRRTSACDELQEDVLQASRPAHLALGPDLVERALGHDAPAVDHRHLVAQPLHHVEHVRGEEEGHAARGQAPQEVAHHAAGDGVDAVERLVEEEHLRAVDEGAGEGQLLAHALRVVHHELAALVGQGEELEELLGAPARLGGARGRACARRRAGTPRRSAARRGAAPRCRTPIRRLSARRSSAEPGARRSTASPAVGRSSPVSMRMVVLLPAPFGPRKPKKRPRATRKDTWSTAVWRRNVFVRPSTTIASVSPIRARLSDLC